MDAVNDPETHISPFYLLSYSLKPLLSLFITAISVPVFLGCHWQVWRNLRMRSNEGGPNGLIMIHLEETEPGAECADSMEFRMGAFAGSYGVRDSLAFRARENSNGVVLTPENFTTFLNLLDSFLMHEAIS